MKRTKREWAELLNGRQYRQEISPQEEAQAKADGIVIVYGASDDLTEFAGAISDELSLGEVHFSKKGKFLPWMDDEIEEFLSDNDLMDIIKERYANSIVSEYTNAWRFKTDIPHATFNVMEDGRVACYGIVFRMDDLK